MSSPKIKILHVVFSLEPGGMENGLVNVAAGLNPSDFEVHVCCLNKGGSFVERLPQPGNVQILGRQTGFSIHTVMGLSRVISKIRPDVIHTHNLGPLTYSVLATFLGFRVAILHGEHGVLPPDQCTPKRVRQRRWFYRCCRKIHTVSAGQRKQLDDLGLPGNRIVTVINGVDTERFSIRNRLSVRRELNLFPENSLVLGIVGRFVALKRHWDLIETFDVLAERFKNLRLLVVGAGGPESERITERVNASCFSERIHLVGFQSDPRRFYQAMDLLVVPSVIEGMSNVVLEAMACGVPVLAHNACGNAEMLLDGEDGIVSDLSTVAKLRGEVEKALMAPARLLEMGTRARQNVAKKFSISGMVDNYAKLYREVAKRS